ncbi:MAG: 3-oxoadipyl-CoA thiolase [Pseudomonas sp.]|jgi:acetyl-CoA acyltransferase|nr:3-oxoadipyl-CoA thiolase [Pseudomonas sp.]MDD2222787.1 3-oxoadipyl-CoA thiolase [Pseudomonas sp.]MDY0413904.1 3-oxoadipyl-CoA thiolase [Pseudomonas sp.]NLO55334.1 3-oxoadipyl-CoA thiolase [Gammaproteobacteria bacterium]
MSNAYICDYVRTPIGRYAGSLSSVRPDDLGAIPLKALLERNPGLDPTAIDDVIFGCANQAGEDNRNVARMSLLLAGYPVSVTGTTINRLCGSSMDAIIAAARAIKSGEAQLIIAGGTESMSRAPFVMPKASSAFTRSNEIHDTTIGWRFVNPKMVALYGVDSMPETGENVAQDFNISRTDQDAFALRSQQRAAQAQAAGVFAEEIVPVRIAQRKGDDLIVETDEHPRASTTADALAKLKALDGQGSVTAGNASGVNDGAAALIIASEEAVIKYGLRPIVKILGGATAGIEPRIMGFAPALACQKLCARLGMSIAQFDVIELNEAFASQALASLRDLGLADDAEHINPNGGAIALGHPLGASGARITGTAALELKRRGKRYALASMCIGVGQGIAIALEAVD